MESKNKKVTTEDGIETTIDDWSFSYKFVEKSNENEGTIIKISNLNSEVVDLFADDGFLNDLSDTRTYQRSVLVGRTRTYL